MSSVPNRPSDSRIVTVAGALDPTAVHDLCRIVRNLFSCNDEQAIVIDLARVDEQYEEVAVSVVRELAAEAQSMSVELRVVSGTTTGSVTGLGTRMADLPTGASSLTVHATLASALGQTF